jgi:hypothetical protein
MKHYPLPPFEHEEPVYYNIDGFKVTYPQVLFSGAGFYIGRMYLDEEFGCEMPYDRLSVYYKSRDEAQRHLDNSTWIPR